MPSSTTYEGWGRASWGQGSWGTPLIIVNVDGLQATGAVGSVSIAADAVVAVTGVVGTGNVGAVAVSGEANVYPSGLEATGNVGNRRCICCCCGNRSSSYRCSWCSSYKRCSVKHQV